MLIYDDPVPEQNLIGKILLIEKKGGNGRLYMIDLEKAHWKAINLFITLFQRMRSALLWKKVKRKTSNH